MKRLFAIFVALCAAFVAVAQSEHSIIIDQSSFRPLQSDALTGVNIDPIGVDSSRRPCARIKVKINRMSREDINKLEVKIHSNNQLTKCKTAEYDNGLIIEMTAKNETRFYFYHPEFGYSNEVNINLEPNKEYYLEASLNQTYSIVVNSNVTDAEVYLDKVFKGRTDNSNSLTIKGVFAGEHTLRLTYGNVSHEQKIEVNSGKISFRQNVDIAASEPQFVVFTVEPQSAVVTIDGKHYTLQDGAMRVVLDGGTYNYTVTAVGYHSKSGTFTVAGEKVTKSISLTADVANVTLTAPNDADIWINGEKKGRGSWSGRLTAGAYIFEAKKEGYRTATLSKHITSAQPQQSYTLPAPTPIYGSIMVDGNPINADVTLDGKPVGQLPLKLDKILVGNHTLKLSKSGYNTHTQTVTVAEGKTVTINTTLTKQTAATSTTTSLTKGATGGSSSQIAGFEMVFVKGGTFTMGATSEQGSDAYDMENPTHSVALSDFYICKYEVTQAQWRAVMGSNLSHFKGDNLPVEMVSWNDVQDFIRKLNAQTGKNFRLPTEAEWEYVARGGNQSKGYKYSGSNDIKSVAWYTNNSSSKTHPVGQKSPNELGIYDMSGNVCEWCQDWYDKNYYSSSSQTNPTGPSSGSSRVLRGGSWISEARGCRVSDRYSGSPDGMYNGHGTGFRLVCSSATTPTPTPELTSAPYAVGDYYNDGKKEGVVFEVSADGKHGKIVSMTEYFLQWSSDETERKRLIGADSRTDGAVNMAKVKARPDWLSKYPVFKRCAYLGDGWYLPAIEELKKFMLDDTIHNAVNSTLAAKGAKTLYNKGESRWYCSSTESNSKCAWGVHMSNGTTFSNTKGSISYVRAVSAF